MELEVATRSINEVSSENEPTPIAEERAGQVNYKEKALEKISDFFYGIFHTLVHDRVEYDKRAFFWAHIFDVQVAICFNPKVAEYIEESTKKVMKLLTRKQIRNVQFHIMDNGRTIEQYVINILGQLNLNGDMDNIADPSVSGRKLSELTDVLKTVLRQYCTYTKFSRPVISKHKVQDKVKMNFKIAIQLDSESVIPYLESHKYSLLTDTEKYRFPWKNPLDPRTTVDVEQVGPTPKSKGNLTNAVTSDFSSFTGPVANIEEKEDESSCCWLVQNEPEETCVIEPTSPDNHTLEEITSLRTFVIFTSLRINLSVIRYRKKFLRDARIIQRLSTGFKEKNLTSPRIYRNQKKSHSRVQVSKPDSLEQSYFSPSGSSSSYARSPVSTRQNGISETPRPILSSSRSLVSDFESAATSPVRNNTETVIPQVNLPYRSVPLQLLTPIEAATYFKNNPVIVNPAFNNLTPNRSIPLLRPTFRKSEFVARKK